MGGPVPFSWRRPARPAISSSMKRHTYARISAPDFCRMLADLGWPDGSKFAWIYGVPPARVTSWMHGEEDIPPAAFLVLQLLQLPGAQQLAIDHTQRVAQLTDRERDRRQAFNERKRQEGGDDGQG